jgi:DegV family protein with EDD domain
MTKIAILTDSSAYLPPELVEQYGIRVIPLTILWGSDSILDGVEITPDEFLERLENDPDHPTTTQPNPEDFTNLYNNLAEGYDAIVAPLISDELSGTINSAQSALSEFDRVPVRVIDSRSTSMGLGFATLAAAQAAADGKTLDEVEHAARSTATASRVMFVVETLEYLHRGGRIGGASKFLGTALSLKPLLHLNEGRVDALEKIRTKKKAVDRLLELAVQYADGSPARASVIHAGVPEEAEALKHQVANQIDCLELHIAAISPAISVHTGPGAVGLALCPKISEDRYS